MEDHSVTISSNAVLIRRSQAWSAKQQATGFGAVTTQEVNASSSLLLVATAFSACVGPCRGITPAAIGGALVLLCWDAGLRRRECVRGGCAFHRFGTSGFRRGRQSRLYLKAFIPGVWLAFSLAYARGDYREFLREIGGASARSVFAADYAAAF